MPRPVGVLRSRSRWLAAAGLVLAVPAYGAEATRASQSTQAELRDPAAAEALFAEGKALLEAGDFQQACPKLEESYRLDPATGALYALALCHEGAGKLATAWVEFMDVAARANAERHPEREASARRHAEALRPRLSSLVVHVHSANHGVSGLIISHDGVALRPAAWGSAIPVDPGRHELRAEAPGLRPWTASFEIGRDPDRKIVEVPKLEPMAPVPDVVTASAGAPPLSVAPGFTTFQVVGIALGSAGTASLGIAALASIRALQKQSESESSCEGPSGCSDAGREAGFAAQEAANWATVSAIAGGVLLGAGVTVFVLGRPPSANRGRSTPTLSVGLDRVRVQYTF